MKKLISFFVGLIIFCVLPVVGWGPGDIAGFIRDPFRLAFILMMAIMSLFVVILVPNEGRGYGEGKKLVRKQKIAILILQIVPLFDILLSPFCDHHRIAVFDESGYIRLAGLLLSFAGFFIMNWSVMVLGKQFSVDVTIQEDHRLVTSGPYRYIRNPRYSGILLFLAGIPVVFLAWIPLILDFLLIFVLLWRIRDEEKLMQEEFGKEWEEYKTRTRSLIPCIY